MLVLLISAVLLAQTDTVSTRSGPCSAELAQVEGQIASPQSNPLEGPTTAQTRRAQLHRQPTSADVKRAEHKADVQFQAALAQARKANAGGDAAACTRALTRAKDLFGIFSRKPATIAHEGNRYHQLR